MTIDQIPWEEVELPIYYQTVFGNFTALKIKILDADRFHNSKNHKISLSWKTLTESNGYWNLDGREFTVTLKNKPILLIRTEDCGLGTKKARLFLEGQGFKIK